MRTRYGLKGGKHTTVQQFDAIRQRAQAAIAFLGWLGTRDLTLDTCQQADLDRWLAGESATYRRPAGHFIRWAHASKLTTVRVTAVRWNGPTQPLDDQHRWDIARRLLHDDGIKPEDRLAGLFLLRYAQGPAAVSRMTTSHIQLGSREVHLTSAWARRRSCYPSRSRPWPAPSSRTARGTPPSEP